MCLASGRKKGYEMKRLKDTYRLLNSALFSYTTASQDNCIPVAATCESIFFVKIMVAYRIIDQRILATFILTPSSRSIVKTEMHVSFYRKEI